MLLGTASSLFAQTPSDLLAKADSLYQAKAYQSSGEAYDAALKVKAGTASNYYNAACSWAQAGENKKALDYLETAVAKGWHNKKWMQKDKDLRTLHAEKKWAIILNQAQVNRDAYEKNFDKTLQTQLEDIYVRDQTLRQLYQEAEKKFGQGSDEMNYFWSLIAQEDSLNEREVQQIIDEKGWVGQSLVGGRANMALWLVIQHAPIETQEKYLPLLKASVKQGESQGNHLALLEDRIRMRKGQPQVYGSQVVTDPKTGKMKVHDIQKPEFVDQRRKSVGLGPIQEYLKRWDIEWTVEQKEQ